VACRDLTGSYYCPLFFENVVESQKIRSRETNLERKCPGDTSATKAFAKVGFALDF
jgi:hypothetical protein